MTASKEYVRCVALDDLFLQIIFAAENFPSSRRNFPSAPISNGIC
jgi:hypothetical protein